MRLGKLALCAFVVESHVERCATPAMQDGLEAELLRHMEVIDAYRRCALLELVYRHGCIHPDTQKDARSLSTL